MEIAELKTVIEAVLLTSAGPMKLEQFQDLFPEEQQPDRKELRAAVEALREDYEGRAMELVEVASGYRIQVRQAMETWVSKLWEEKPARYSRALLETLALVAYRQPITRAEIEDVRGVSVSSSIMKTLQDREWVRVVGHRDVPGKPAMFGTTKQFLDYFGLSTLDDLPTLQELRDIDSINAELDLGESGPTMQVVEGVGEGATEGEEGVPRTGRPELAVIQGDAGQPEEEAAGDDPAPPTLH